MQELLDSLSQKATVADGETRLLLNGLIWFVRNELLEKEKQQIIDAGDKTLTMWLLHDCERHGNEMPDGKMYYNKTFLINGGK